MAVDGMTGPDNSSVVAVSEAAVGRTVFGRALNTGPVFGKPPVRNRHVLDPLLHNDPPAA
jgi:hypothetical protein